MNARQLTFPMPGNGTAILTLPQPMTRETLLELERSVAAALGNLQRETYGATAGPGHIEYASWLQQLGAVRH